jgi:uncharacterized caspase-like protein
MRSRIILLALGLFLAAAGPSERRTAVVIGVGAYQAIPRLANTKADATAMAAALGRLGFDVDLVLDPDRDTLQKAARDLGIRARSSDVALFFYAGHAFELSGHNWLVPVNADVRSDRDVPFETLDLDLVLGQLDQGPRFAFVILDACRENPFRTVLAASGRGLQVRPGLAAPQNAMGQLVAFATAPGTEASDGTGPNSPFTAALLKHIETPGLEIRQLLAETRHEVRTATGNRQVPWETSALEGEFYFVPAAAAPAPSSAASAADPSGSAEALFWDSIRNSRDPAEFRAYLSRYPQGTFAELARIRLAALGTAGGAASTQSTDTSWRKVADAMRLAMPSDRVQQTLPRYRRATDYRALAIEAGSGRSFWWDHVDNQRDADDAALEACQQTYNTPCVLVVEGEELAQADPRAGTTRIMLRITYAGPFKPEMVPFMLRTDPLVLGYGAAAGAKAIAIHPAHRIKVVSGESSIAVAEAKALDGCNRKDDAMPCFLYASGDRVILTERRTEATR